MSDYSISLARYAKGKLIVSPTRDGTGYKTRAARLIGDGLNCRWVHRGSGYVASPTQVKKFEKLYAAGFSACVMTGKIYHPERPEIDGLTVAEALRLCE